MNKIFLKAFNRTRQYEIGYVNDPDDSGGETYNGISRKYNPDWAGWEIIDQVKGIDELNTHNKEVLDNLEKQLYYNRYWKHSKLDLDNVSIRFPHLAVQLYDMAVNMGVSEAAINLQIAINILNRDQGITEDIKVDGWVGSKTIRSLFLFNKQEEEYFVKTVLILKGFKYIDIAMSKTSQEKFIRGWLSRVVFEEK